MKNITWRWLLPDWSKHDFVWKNPKPFSLWNIGGNTLIGLWLNRSVEHPVNDIEIHTADRPDQIRAFLGDGSLWSKNVTIIPITSDDSAPEDAIPLVGLPANNRLSLPFSKKGDLLRHWLALNLEWIENLDTRSLKIEIEQGKGGWIGPQVKIHPTAKLVPPFWIQGKSEIGRNARIGPNACIGENTLVDEEASIESSIILPGTMVGRNTMLDRVVADGGLLMDTKRASRIIVSDSFILGKVDDKKRKTGILEKSAAALLFLILSPLALLKCKDCEISQSHDGKGGYMSLKTGKKGALAIRRWHWLLQVAKGNMHLFGILPRNANWSIGSDPELEERLKETTPGVFSLSDLHDCHSAANPEEWIHASYQALSDDKRLNKLIQVSLWKTLFKQA